MVKLQQFLPLSQEATVDIDSMAVGSFICGVLKSLDLFQVLQKCDYDVLFLSALSFCMEEAQAEGENALLV